MVAALDTHSAVHDAISANSQQSQPNQHSQQSQPLIIVVHEQDHVDEQISVGKFRSTRRRRRDDDDKDGISAVSAMQANNDNDNNGDDGLDKKGNMQIGVVRGSCRSDLSLFKM